VTSPEHQPTTEQPAQDSAGGNGLLPGGMTPELEAKLQQAPPDVRQAVMEDLSQRNSDYTRRMQALQGHVRKAAILEQLQRIPDFSDFLQASQANDLAGFYRRKSGGVAPTAPAARAGTAASGNGSEQPSELGFESTSNQTDDGLSQGQLSSVLAKLESQEQTVQELKTQFATSQASSQAEVFGKANPDWQDWYPNMLAVLQEPGMSNLGLQDALDIAKSRANRGPAPSGAAVEPGAQTPAQQSGTPQPPVPVGAAGTLEGAPRARTIAEAAKQASQHYGGVSLDDLLARNPEFR